MEPTPHDPRPRNALGIHDACLGEALDWLVRLNRLRASETELHALQRWCARSAAHAQAWREAVTLWRLLLPAARAVPPERRRSRPHVFALSLQAIQALQALQATMVPHPKTHRSLRATDPRPTPLARAVAVALAAFGAAAGPAHAGQAFSPAWFANKGAAQAGALQSGRLPNGMPASSLTNPVQQQQQASEQLQRSMGNLNLAAQAIAAQQAAQAAARQAALQDPASVPDGLAEGGLKIDTQSLSAGWANANAPVQSQQADGRTNVAIQQTGDRAILNWETFNVGKHTTVDFRQQADWAVLNRVNDPQARPSQIQGQIKADGTVLIANRNGVVFSGSSQTDTRNLVAAAAKISDDQFKARGIHSAASGDTLTPSFTPSFTDANGAVTVEAGARLQTATPTSVKQGGGYVLLMGKEVSNAGTIATPRGQAQLAAGDFFIVRPGQGTAANQASTTRGNEVSPQFVADSSAGRVTNTGLLQATEGDITLAGRTVVQAGVAVATTTVDARGTVHLLNSASDALGSVTLAPGALSAVLLDAQGGRTALDSQRDALVIESAKQDMARAAAGAFDNLSLLGDRRDQSRIEIVSGGSVLFDGGSTTLATGGQIAVSAGRNGQPGGRSTVADGARLDVSGAVGVQVAMSSNNVQINIQGNEQRDAPLNRDTSMLNNANVWIDRRKLVRVAPGTGGYEGERWYTPGGLLEVGGYLGLQGHTVGEWAAQGGSVSFAGAEVVTHKGSNINLSGGTLDVQTGMVRQSWLKGTDGRLYEVSSAPADVSYTGLYKGFEDAHERWGEKTTGYFYNPLIGPQQRLENGYTVGRDAGRLVVATTAATIEGDVTAKAYQGPRQVEKGDAALDGYAQSHNAAAHAAQLVFGSYTTGYNADAAAGPVGVFHNLAPTFERIVFEDAPAAVGSAGTSSTPDGVQRLDSRLLRSFGLGSLTALATKDLKVDGALTVEPGGRIALHATQVAVNADLTARGGTIALGNVLSGTSATGQPLEGPMPAAPDTPVEVVVAKGVTLDARGLWSNLLLDAADVRGLPYLDGGAVSLRSAGAVTLAASALIDVSSGGAVLASGKTRGGRGGDVALLADDLSGAASTNAVLTLDGDVRGYGASGGGTLRVSSGTAIVVGGSVLGVGGMLAAGMAAPTDLILLQDYQVHAGDVLPVDYSYQRTVARPGEAVGTVPSFSATDPVTLAADWKLPAAAEGGLRQYTVLAIVDGVARGFVGYRGSDGTPSDTVPAGAQVTGLIDNGIFPIGYVVPANVFPQGFGITPETSTLRAGTVATADFNIASGTRVASGAVFTQAVSAKPGMSVDAGLLQSGFSRYDLNGHLGTVVADNARLDVRMPVYRFPEAAKMAATGSDPAAVLERWTPPQWLEDPVRGVLAQRGGASLVLQSTTGTGASLASSGPVDVRAGATVTVDAGQSVALRGRDVTVNGVLGAPAGTIAIDGDGLPGKPGVVWIGEHAVLDVAARAATARDIAGRPYGRVADGGTIRIGGTLDWEQTGKAAAPEAFVVVRSGALLDASGTSAVVDSGNRNTAPVTLASNGGTIVIKSSQGLYLDGTLRAAAGGEGAAGGMLALALESAPYLLADVRGDVLRHREMVLAQVQGDSPLAGVADPADARRQLRTGTARLGIDRIEAGGFDNLSLLVHGPLAFDGDVALRLGQSLRLHAGTYAHSEASAVDATVSLAAPYVRLAGTTGLAAVPGVALPSVAWADGPSQQAGGGRFSVDAELIDVRDRVGFGAHGDVNLRTATYTVDRRGFADVDLSSRGDIRLLAGQPAQGLPGDLSTELATSGNLSLTAQQVYPATGASAQVLAGYTRKDPFSGEGGAYVPGSVLAIHRQGQGKGEAEVAMPYSAFGSLLLGADTIEQGGVVRAPLGRLLLGSHSSDAVAQRVSLLPGSVTSVSGDGLLMPYGGTVDGLSYLYNGKPVTPDAAGGMQGGQDVLRGIQLSTRHVDAQAGSVLDLSGGGTLAGAGFVSGRGGSVDVLKTPLVNANPANGYSSKGNAVYAIVPGSAAQYAPVAPDAGFGAPGIGQQITVPAGVPGLPAGTYTLMPSTYALLPGAFRVEIGAPDRVGLGAVTGIGNGSYVAPGVLGVAHTAIREALPNQVVITPGAKVRTQSAYNETNYNAFVRADAARLGFLRGMLTSDAKTLDIVLTKPDDDDAQRTGLRFDGLLRIGAQPATDGYGGTVNVRHLGEVLADGQAAAAGLAGASVEAGDLNRLGASRLVLNGAIGTRYGQQGRMVDIAGEGSLVVRSGAQLSAAEIFLASAPHFMREEAIVLEEGASLSTVGRGAGSFGSNAGYVFSGNGVVALSNGWINLLLAAPAAGVNNTVTVEAGRCTGTGCNTPTRLASEGTIAIATDGALTLAPNVAYGTRNLSLAVAAVNLGNDASIAAADAAGQLPRGLVLDQARLDRLLAGNTAIGAPALETLVLNARDAVNIYGGASLDASSLQRLVLGTPAIYGYGAAGDVATIRAGEFVWSGSQAVPGAAMAGQLGDGTLEVAARSIVLGHGPYAPDTGTENDARLALGFGEVRLTASERVTSGGHSALAVYHRQGAYVPGEGFAYEGGDLVVTAPVLTGQAGSKTRITAGGALTVVAPQGTATLIDTSTDALGATLELRGRSVGLEGSIVLPSGRLVLAATGDVVLGAASRIDLAGREVPLFDVKKYSWGGDLVLSSAAGNIAQAAGSVIDVSARNSHGGSIEATALGAGAGAEAGAGRIDLLGTLRGGATGSYDAGGTVVPYDAGEFTLRAQTLADFAGLNQRLNEGGVFGARRFQLKQGDLVVGDEVKARDVAITVDGGSLRVNGRIDASGYQVGTIRLAAKGDLRVDGVLDAHGSGLRVDSHGKVIDSPNRAVVELTTRDGMLTLGSGAQVDLRAGTGVATAQNDGRARGTLDLNAPRTGADDVAVTVEGTPAIRGAKTVAVNAFRSYDDAPLAPLPDVSGFQPQLITQAMLDRIDGDSVAFIDAALGNAALRNRLAGLGRYSLRPGVEIVSNVVTNPHGDLTVAGDIDLSGYRYGPGAHRGDPALRGFGEPGVLVIRAANDLNINGSINDGFAPPPATPDDAGWYLRESSSAGGAGGTPFGGDIVVPIDGVVLDTGTRFPAGAKLNYSVPVGAATLPAGTVLPVDAVLAGPLALAAGTVVSAAIYNADGSVAYAAGTVLPAAANLAAGMRLGAGTALRAPAAVAALTWPKGVPLPVDMTVAGPLALARGSLIPSMTQIELPGDQPVNLRPAVDGVQGRNWAVAPMLGEGASSWSLQLVAGADVASADRRALNPASKGAIRLGDTHYVSQFTIEMVGGAKTVWAEGNWYGYEPGTVVTDDLLGLCADAGQCVLKQDYVWAEGNYFGYPAGTPVSADELFWCEIDPALCMVSGGQPTVTARRPAAPSFSVVRTGTGDLSLDAAGDIRTDSLYGIYTAGTATAPGAGFDQPRGRGADGTLIGPQDALLDYGPALASYRAWYPEQGGNVRVAAGGNLMGDLTGLSTSSVLPGNWLWRQGSGGTAIDTPIPAAWWINFGAYTRTTDTSNARTAPDLAGFTGIGALGGGNVTVRVGGDAGAIDLRGARGGTDARTDRSQGLVVAVGGTGRVGADGSLNLTGGGDIDMRVAGALNPNRLLNDGEEKLVLTGAVANLRGATQLVAGSIGSVGLQYLVGAARLSDAADPRGIDPFRATLADARGGINLVPGDTAVYLQARGDLALGGAADPGRGLVPNSSTFSVGGTAYGGGGQGWFSLWTGHSAIDLLSAGGQLTPSMATDSQGLSPTVSRDGWIVYPSIFRAAALSGSLFYGGAALPQWRDTATGIRYSLTLAPSATGQLEMLAADSIYAGEYAVGMSGSGTRLPTPFDPAFAGVYSVGDEARLVTNTSAEGTARNGDIFTGPSLFAFGPNTAAVGIDRAPDAPPVRFYAARGDIVGLRTGELVSTGPDDAKLVRYNAAAPVRILAGRDIVGAGMAPGASRTGPYELDGASIRGNLVVHRNATDVSVVSAGRDVLYANFDVAGPGTLEISAGRNLLQEDRGGLASIGPIVAGDPRPGASIALMAGVGAGAGSGAAGGGLDMSAIRARYLEPSKLADAGTPLAEQPGKAAKTYEKELATWLAARYGFSGGTAQALAFFDALAPEQQRIFLREVYYAELREGGREYTNPASSRSGSYLRGREMIATLFPEKDTAGNPVARGGDITMFGGSGVRTNFGGDIEMLAPGGKIVLGVQGTVPPATSGVMTQGQGDIRMYSEGSLLLGLSRVMTTFGGDIFAWSARGDINAGRGAKTTVLFTPPKRVYDNVGNAEISPQAPSAGAGIATLAPIAEVPPGDVDLIAPLGTIDAGEAGIRVSGNVNVAALQVVNAANIQVKGQSAGLPVVASVNVGALSNASAAASQAATAAQDVLQRERAAQRQALPSVFTVRVLGFGNEPAGGGASDEKASAAPEGYNPRSVIRVLGGGGKLPPSASRQLTDEERANLQR